MSLQSFMRLARWLYVVVLAVACNRFDEDPIPSYLKTESFSLSTQPLQGSSSSSISELWFYEDGNILGVVDTPVALPLLESGMHTITVFPGIKNNGMGTSRIKYPFYTSFDTTLQFVPGETYTIEPRFAYTSSAIVDATRNFEAGNTFIASSNNNGIIELLNDPLLAASGVRCARMKLPAGASLLSYIDEENISLEAGEVAFLEMDYSCNNTFVVGVYVITGGNSIKVPVLYLTPTQSTDGTMPDYNKIYMDLGMIASQYIAADDFRLYVECTREEAEVPTIYMDDIKIVK